MRFTPEEFVALLPKLQPRLYSIASSLKAHPDAVHFIVDVVSYKSHGRKRKGVCSSFLGGALRRFPRADLSDGIEIPPAGG